MKTTLSTLLLAFLAIFISAAQEEQNPCIWPTYDVTVAFAPGEVVFDLYQALLDDGIVFWDQSYCSASIGDSGCFYQITSINEAFLGLFPDGCFIDQWDIILSPDATQEACCGNHVLPYTLSYQSGDTTMYCTGNINLTIECGQDCGLIDFSDPAFSSPIDPDGTAPQVECIQVCENSSLVAFAPVFGSGGFIYDWVVQGGVLASGQNTPEAHVEWGPNGSGNISVTISNIDPNFTPITYSICIEILEGPEALFSSAGYVCLNNVLQFTDLSSPGATNYVWDWGDGLSDTYNAQTNPSHSYTTPGTYDVTLTVFSDIIGPEGNVLCTCSDTYTEEILVDNLVGPDIQCISTLCENDTSSYFTNADCDIYVWSVFDALGAPILSFTGQGTNEIFVQWGLGPYGTVELMVEDCMPAHCNTPTSVQVPIIPINGSINGPEIVCQGEIASYDLTKWISVDYDWSVTGGTLINQEGSIATIQWYNSGIGTIDVTYTSDFLQNLPGHGPNDCTGFATLNVEVKPKFFVSPSTLDVCIDATTIFTASGSLGGVFDWTNSGGLAQNVTGNTAEITWSSSGTYTVTADLNAANPDLYCNSTVTSFITVHEVAPPTAVTGPIEVCVNSPSYIYEVAASQGLNAIWTPSSTNPGGGLPSANPSVGLYTEVTWGMSGLFNLEVVYQMADAPYCNSNPFTLVVEERTHGPAVAITSPDAPCANEIANYSISDIHPDATIHWTIDLPQYGSVVGGQGTDNMTVQWNDIPSNSVTTTVTATVELCGITTIYTMGISLNRAIVPTVVGTDFCVGTSGTVAVSNAGSFISPFNWVGSLQTTSSISTVSAGDYIANTIDINGCASSGGATISILPAPMLNLTTNGPTTLVNGVPGSTEIVAPYNPNYSYSWSPGGATTPTITHNWQGGTLPNSYTYTLTITEISSGCTNTESLTIYEVDVVGGGGPCTGPCCDLETYSLTPSALLSGGYCDTWAFSSSGSSSNVTNVNWNFGDLSGSSSNPTTHTYTEIGYYDVIMSGQVPNAAGTAFCSVSEMIVVEVAMIAQFGTEVSCAPNPTDAPQLCLTDETAYLPGTSISAINFTVGSSNSSLSPSCFGSLTSGSPYTAYLTATHSSGCIDDFTQAVTIPGPVTISGPTPLCIEESGAFSATCAGAVSFDWNFDDTSVGANDNTFFDGASPQHAYAQNPITQAQNGPYNPVVSVVATHVNGCQFTNSINIVVNDLPPGNTITSLDGDFMFCFGFTETLEVSPLPPSQVTWWSTDPGTPVGSGTSLEVSAEGEYGATIFNPVTGCSTELDPVLVQQWPVVPAFITGPSILCDGDCTNLIAPSGNYIYQWYNMANTLLGSTMSIEVCSSQISGSDLILLKVIDPVSGCSNTYDLAITVEQSPTVQIGTFPDPPCEGSEVTLFVDPLDPLLNYVWTGGQTGQTFTTLSEGIYTVVAIDPLTGCKGSANETVHPCPNLCEVPTGCYMACDSGKTVCGPLGLASYEWNYIPPGSNVSTIVGMTRCITMTQDGDYSLTAENIYGCPKTSGLLEMEFINCDSCQFSEPDMLDLQLLSLGTSIYSTDIDGDGVNEDVACCLWSVNPLISSANGANPSTLCMDIIWGDGTIQTNLPLGSPVEHCYTDGCTDYPVTVKIKCCDDGSNAYGFNATAFCDCVPDCYVRNSFWEAITQVVGADKCHIEFTGTQFLGPNMVSYQNPEYTITGVENSGNLINLSSLSYGGGYNFSFDLNPGVYEVCYSIEGVSTLGEICRSEHCHEVVVDCCGDPVVSDDCFVNCSNLEVGLGLVDLGTSTDDAGNICCEYGLSPEILSSCQVDLFDLCINIDWGDDSAPLQNVGFPYGYTHCFPSGGTYTVTLDVFCCAQGQTQSWTFTETVICNGGGCEIPQDVDFDWGTNMNCPTTGCDQMWFCPINLTGQDPNTCISWDFGDGNIYNPSLPDCPIHCYNSGGNYDVCLTVYCCDEGKFGPSAYTICHTINVSCGVVEVVCTGDYDLDGFIGVIDLLELLGAYGGACE
jgi:PKD repeat protein